MKEQVLDSMDIERERGITIKAQTVRLSYRAKDGKDYVFNLMDTPGHVDFAYEVSRSLAACEGSLLGGRRLAGASRRRRSPTSTRRSTTTTRSSRSSTRSTLPAAEPEQVKQQIEDVIGIDASDAIMVSAKTGLGIPDVLEAIVTRLPPPQGDRDAPLKALLVDSWYDVYLGVVVLIRSRRCDAEGPAHPHDGHQCGLRRRARRRVHAEDAAGRGARPRRDRLHHRRDQGGGRYPRRRHHY